MKEVTKYFLLITASFLCWAGMLWLYDTYTWFEGWSWLMLIPCVGAWLSVGVWSCIPKEERPFATSATKLGFPYRSRLSVDTLPIAMTLMTFFLICI